MRYINNLSNVLQVTYLSPSLGGRALIDTEIFSKYNGIINGVGPSGEDVKVTRRVTPLLSGNFQNIGRATLTQ